MKSFTPKSPKGDLFRIMSVFATLTPPLGGWGVISIFLLLLTGIFSCREPFDINTRNSDPVVVIYGCLTDDWVIQSIQVSLSTPYFDNQKNPGISGAVVQIEGSDHSVFQFTENAKIPGLYQTEAPVAGVPGVTYTLTVTCDMNRTATYQASSTMLSRIDIDSIQVVPSAIAGHHLFLVNLFAQDSPEKDYYLCKFMVNDSMMMKNLSRYQVMYDEIYNGQYISGLCIYEFRDGNYKSDFFDSKTDSIHYYVYPGDMVTLEMSKIEKDYAQFINDCRREKHGSNPFFGGPPANIVTNISNGAVGYFAAYSISRAVAVAQEEKL